MIKKMFFIFLFMPHIYPATWSGGSTPSVIDDDLLIDGSCTFSGNRSITADTLDVTVTVDNDAVVNGSSHILELITTSVDREITFNITADDYVTNLTDPTTVAVHLDQPAGLEPIVELKSATNDSAYANMLIINKNINLPELYVDPTRNGLYTGDQSGCILGTNSTLRLKNNTYLDYVGTTTNIDPWSAPVSVLQNRLSEEILKARNASALFVDGAPAGTEGALNARILMEENSGIFFRSGADLNGSYTQQSGANFSFLITPTAQPAGAGNIIFDIEGALNILGDSDGTNIINILSREVDPTGGLIEIGEGDAKFPQITFAEDAQGDLLQYAKACML